MDTRDELELERLTESYGEDEFALGLARVIWASEFDLEYFMEKMPYWTKILDENGAA